MKHRIVVPAIGLASLAMVVGIASSVATYQPSDCTVEPLQDAASASEVQSEPGASKEHAKSKGESDQPPSPVDASQDGGRLPPAQDIEPLGEPMFA